MTKKLTILVILLGSSGKLSKDFKEYLFPALHQRFEVRLREVMMQSMFALSQKIWCHGQNFKQSLQPLRSKIGTSWDIGIGINIGIMIHQRVNWYYQSVSLLCPTGSFTLSLSLVTCRSDLVCVFLLPPPSTVSIYPSLYRVVPNLFLSLYVFLRSCLCSFLCSFLCSCSCSYSSQFDRIYPSV